jgi:hypothetical protein
MLFNHVIAAKILWIRMKPNALKTVDDISPSGITCKTTDGQQISYATDKIQLLEGYVCDKKFCNLKFPSKFILSVPVNFD